jgi:hypothetical protein
MPPKKNVKVVKVPLDKEDSQTERPQAFPKMQRMYLELMENKTKIKQDLINKEHNVKKSPINAEEFDKKLDDLLDEKPKKKDKKSVDSEKPKDKYKDDDDDKKSVDSEKPKDKYKDDDDDKKSVDSEKPKDKYDDKKSVDSEKPKDKYKDDDKKSVNSEKPKDKYKDDDKKSVDSEKSDKDDDKKSVDSEKSDKYKDDMEIIEERVQKSKDSDDDLSVRLKELLNDTDDEKSSSDTRKKRKEMPSSIGKPWSTPSPSVQQKSFKEKIDKYSRSAGEKPMPNYKKSPPTLAELESKGVYQAKKELRDINHVSVNEQEEEDTKRELLFKFELLKKSYANSNVTIPEYSIHSDLLTMRKSYESTVRRLSLDSSVEQYKTYLIGGFMACEFIFGNFLKFDMQGFTQQQIVSMHSYEKLLIEIGEKSYVPNGSNWPVEVRLLFMIIMNAAFFLISKMIMKKTGSNLMGMINTLNTVNTANPPKPKRKMRGPDIDLDTLP